MTRKIFNSIFIVTGISLLASIVIIIGFLYRYFGEVQENGLKDELELSIAAMEQEGDNYLKKIQSDHYRITWIAGDGTVLYDTITGTENKENHLERIEVKRALETGEGKSKRYSNTLLEKTIYYAKRMKDGTVLRISINSATIWFLVFGMLQPILIVVMIALIMSAILAGRLSKRIVKPFNNLDLENPLDNDIYEEISPLLNRIYKQNNKIKIQLKELQQKSAEFTQITACMKEGLVLMDKNGIILSINPAANYIFSLKESSVGKNFLTIYRDHEVNLCIKSAMELGHSEIQQSRFGREYQFLVSKIESENELIGAVLLIFDVTEKVLAEHNRREFTANVSHELKTPLQGIIGSVELIENNMVKQEDIPRFIGHIRKEAIRLVTLVNDIIRLSQLDEKMELIKEENDLLEIIKEVVESLQTIAEERKIEIIVHGESSILFGVKKLLYDIVYNLCDNAIKYNLDGGSVKISVKEMKESILFTVSDTGIGIGQEHIDRVFERFYRVDKSHSKESGGTGLGLSIVKHAVAYHHGKIEIQSELGKGTTICVEFPMIQ